MNSFETLRTLFGEERYNEKVILRPFEKSLLRDIGASFYKGVLDYMELVLADEKDELLAYIDHLDNQNESRKSFILVCFERRDDTFCGITQLKHLDFFNLKCEMGGTWYAKNYQGKGFNMACKRIVFEFVFEVLNFRRLQFSIDKNNIASIKSMKKIGATEEGVFRKNWVDSDGVSRDDYYFSITDDDWYKLKDVLYKI